MTTLYGIKNCDTIRKARRWLDDNGVEYTFHDVRSDGLDKKTLQTWEVLAVSRQLYLGFSADTYGVIFN